MLAGIAILVATIVLLAVYARGLEMDRTLITRPLLVHVGIGGAVGIVTGAFLSFFVLSSPPPMIELMILASATGTIIGGGVVILGGSNTSYLLPNNLWGWLSVIFTISQSLGFASNSYTIWEDEMLLFFLTTFGIIAGVSSMRQRTTSDRVLGVYHSILFIIFSRIASMSRLCREEQMAYCRSTYYASSTSSTFAAWQLVIPAVMTLVLPTVIRAFYVGSKSYEGFATLWIGVIFRIGLLATTMYWTIEAADNGEWIIEDINKETLKSARVFLAQFVLILAFGVGLFAYIYYSKPCISVSMNKQTITILGYGNVYGTRYMLLVVSVCLAAILVQKPMGQGAMGLMVWQMLSLLEILDTNSLGSATIGPVVFGLLGSFYFFKTGHQAVLSSIQWEAAFVALSNVKYPWSPVLIVLNTFAAQILAAVASPLAVLWKRSLVLDDHEPLDEKEPLGGRGSYLAERKSSSSSSSSSSGTALQIPPPSSSSSTSIPVASDSFQSYAAPQQQQQQQQQQKQSLLSATIQASTTHLLYLATINLFTTLWAGHLRRHLMLYRVFSPRFMMGAAVLGVCDLVVLVLAFGVGVRYAVFCVGEVFGW